MIDHVLLFEKRIQTLKRKCKRKLKKNAQEQSQYRRAAKCS